MQALIYSHRTSWSPSPTGAPSSQKPLQSCKSLAFWIKMNLSRHAVYSADLTGSCELNRCRNKAFDPARPGQRVQAAGRQALCLYLKVSCYARHHACPLQLQAEALRGLYTLWYAAGTSLGLLPPLPAQQTDILPAFAIDLPIRESMSIKDGRLGYTNKILTWQVELMRIPDPWPCHGI